MNNLNYVAILIRRVNRFGLGEDVGRGILFIAGVDVAGRFFV